MAKIQTRQLTGLLLDWAAGVATGHHPDLLSVGYRPSIDAGQARQLMTRHQIRTWVTGHTWHAQGEFTKGAAQHDVSATGVSEFEAVVRCCVVGTLGEVIVVPPHLLKQAGLAWDQAATLGQAPRQQEQRQDFAVQGAQAAAGEQHDLLVSGLVDARYVIEMVQACVVAQQWVEIEPRPHGQFEVTIRDVAYAEHLFPPGAQLRRHARAYAQVSEPSPLLVREHEQSDGNPSARPTP